MTSRLPALPIIANDPYFSYWMAADTLTETDTTHWSGPVKPVRIKAIVDGKVYRLMGLGEGEAARTLDIEVTATRTIATELAANVRVVLSFLSPMLPEKPDVFSVPATFIDWEIESTDGNAHEVEIIVEASECLSYESDQALSTTVSTEKPVSIEGAVFHKGDLNLAYLGQSQQKVLCHSGDHITIDWGYLYLAGNCELSYIPRNNAGGYAEGSDLFGAVLKSSWKQEITAEAAEESERKAVSGHVIISYDDIASINYFGSLCKAWYQRDGKTLPEALEELNAQYETLKTACIALDEAVRSEALAASGEAYAEIAQGSWRHTFAAHKLIADSDKQMVLLSKENDSNGCIGTVDVSYPSTPIFLRYNPELVNALIRPVLKFAKLPVWTYDFAPHDVGRYPYATGQVYSAILRQENGKVHPLYYLYDERTEVYFERNQMPVEECGNMLVMAYAAIFFGASDKLSERYLDTLALWVNYLDQFGEDPGEQLCTDDFAGHLSRNVNLSAKAIVGVACYSKLLEHFNKLDEAKKWSDRAKEMADHFLKRVSETEDTPLTYDGIGWSMKYNLVWDKVMDLQLLPESFYEKETKSYLKHMNAYGLPLDSRADYTKSDWECWCAAMASDRSVRAAILAPLSAYLRESKTRVPFSDWYDTKTGDYVHFIARSVQGGVYMPMLVK